MTIESLSITAALFSIFLALFAIWLAFQQRRESRRNYEESQKVLGEMEKVMEKTEILVSENFQSLLTSVVDQQRQMLDSLKPRPTVEEKYADLLVKLASESPDKLERMADVVTKMTSAQQKQTTPDPFASLAALAKLAEGASPTGEHQ